MYNGRRRRRAPAFEAPNLQNYLLLEDTAYYLLEDGFRIKLEEDTDQNA